MTSIFYYPLPVEAAEEAAAALVTLTPPDDGPQVPPRGQRYNPFNKEQEAVKTVSGSRHREFQMFVLETM